jgi:hypothetical protein
MATVYKNNIKADVGDLWGKSGAEKSTPEKLLCLFF